ncbi:hypothetical protein Ancab_005830 [Ancistrocladus abbreviatus]
MDSQLEELYGSLLGINFNDQSGSVLSSQNFFDALKLADSNLNNNSANPALFLPNPNCTEVVPSMGESMEGNNHCDDLDLSDVVLKYISQVLMEEDVEERIGVYGPSALEATEKSLYEAIGKKYPPSQNEGLKRVGNSSLNENDNEDCFSYTTSSSGSSGSSSSSSNNNSKGNCLSGNPSECKSRNVEGFAATSRPLIQASFGSSNSSGAVIDADSQALFSSSSNTSGGTEEFAYSSVSAFSISKIFNDESVAQFNKGVEEAYKLLLNGSLYVGLESAGILTHKSNVMARGMAVKLENNYEYEYSAEFARGKKHRHPDDFLPEDGRDNKLSAVSNEAVERSEMFDRVLLCSRGENDAALRKDLQNGMNKSMQDSQSKGSNGGRRRGSRKGSKRDLVDLRSLLSLCAQAVASNDQRTANELLKQIKQHSSPTGDGNQRMAHYFAEGLEARLAGAGTQTYMFVVNGPSSAADVLRAYHLFLATCPFKKISNFVSNRTIMDVTEKAKKVHIIDFGILYGFQWPCLIERLSSRPGGPPMLKITGIDLPQPGFRPGRRVEETGRRLKNYANSFSVPFEFNAIAKKWETVLVEDLEIDDDEVLIVNSLYRFKYLHDETVMVESPRNRVLKLIRKINPAVFILGIVNGAYNAPFFITRFREALFHFSTLFDMLEVNVPREREERMLIEKEIFGRQVVNAIACEGFERIERPETYKQWHVRNERAGFRQLPLNREIVSVAKDRVKSCYHKDFVIDEDGNWLLQGWKGRIVFGLSCWKPAH